MSQQERFEEFYNGDDDNYSWDYLSAANQQEATNAINWAREKIQAASDNPDEDPIGFGRVVRNVAEIPRGVGTGVVEGLNEAVATIYQLGDALGPYLPEFMNWRPELQYDEDGSFAGIGINKTQYDSANPSTPPALPNLDAPETGLGQFTNEVSQFLTGFAGAGKFLKPIQGATRAGKIGKAMAQGGIADFAFMSPFEARVSDFIQAVPELENPVTEFLASSPEDAAMEGRLKNAMEGLGLGVAADGMMAAFKAVRGARWFRNKFPTAEEAGRNLAADLEGTYAEREAGDFLRNLGDLNAPLVRETSPEDVLSQPARQAGITQHEKGVTGLSKSNQKIMDSVDWQAAKNNDLAAANRVVDQIWGDKQTRELAAKLDPGKETVFVSVPSTSGANKLPDALGKKLAREMGGEFVQESGLKVLAEEAMKNIGKADRPFAFRDYSLGDAEAAKRLVGKQVVVVEDVLTTGSSARQFVLALRGQGVDVHSVAGLMGNARLDAPPQLVSKLQKTLKNAGMDIKGKELADVLSSGEIEAIIETINKAGGADARNEIAGKLRGLLHQRTAGTVAEHPAQKAGRPEAPPRDGGGDAGSSVGVPSDGSALGSGYGGKQNLYNSGPEASGALRDRPGPDSGHGRSGNSADAGRVEINFARIDSPEDIKTVMQNVADLAKTQVDEARRGRRSFKEIELSAEQEDAWKILAERRQGDPLNAEQSVAARNLWASSTEKLAGLARAAQENPSNENLFAFRKMLAIQDAIQKEVIAARTETARALSSWRINAGSHDQMAEQMSSLLDAFGGTEVNRDLAARVAMLSQRGMVTEMGELVGKSMYARSRDAVQEAWVMALLSSPKTHLVNMMGNTLTAFQQVFERAAAARIGRALGDATGVQIGEASAMLTGMIGGLKDGLRLAGKAFKMDQGGAWANKVELRPTPSIASEHFNLAKDSFMGKAVDVIGQVVRTPGRALTAEDEFFKSVGYRAELHAQAFRQANREAAAGQIPKDQVKARMAELVGNPPRNIHLAAVDSATYVTFTNAPGQFAQGWMRLTQQNPSLRFITPFIKTPANIFNYALTERSPLAPLFRGFREDIAAGGARQQLALARASTGTATMMIAADLAFSGAITGDGPASPAERQTLIRTGWQPNSIKIGDRYYSYSRMDPIGLTLGIAANLAEISNHMDQEDREVDADEAAIHFAASIASSVMSKNYMRGLSDFMEMLAEPQGRAESYVNRFAGGFVPAIVGEAARQVDPYMLEVNSMVDAMRARIPGLSKDLPARRDLWGRAITYRSGLGTFYDAISPIASRRENPEPIDQEMLQQECYVAAPKKTVSFGGVNVDLTRWEGAYSRYAELAGNEVKNPAWQKGCMDFLNQVVSGGHPLSALYKMKSDGPEGGKADFIRATVMEYRKMAREQLIKEYPEIREYIGGKSAGPLSKWNFQGAGNKMPTIGQ